VRSLHLAALLMSGVIACESMSSPSPVLERDVTPDMVTGAALAALRPDGRLVLETPSTGPGQLPIQDAEAQSLQFARYVTNHLLLRGVVEGERGGYWTDPHLLTICGDSYYVHSQLGAIVTDTFSTTAGQSFLRRFGPQWIVPMCGSANEPQMTVQAAIDGNDIRFADGEPIEPYAALTTAWYARGVPLNWPDVLTISAERAVRFAYETFGVRVSEVPRLMFRGDVLSDGRYVWYQVGSARFCNRWRVVLESEVAIRGMTSLTTSTTDTLYVGALSCSRLDVTPYVHLPLATQPTAVILDYLDNSVTPAKTWIVDVPVVSPIRFEPGTRAP
jgi:hypothetical protein